MRTRWCAPLAIACAAVACVSLPAPAGASLAWEDDPCEDRGGQVALAPDMWVVVPDGPAAYVACVDGTLLHHGKAAGPVHDAVAQVTADDFVDIASTPDGRGVYAVTRDGRVRTIGAATYYGGVGSAYDVVGIEMTPGGGGYWLATTGGEVVGFGDARTLGPRKTTVISSAVVAFAAASESGGWVVTADGQVVPVGDAPQLASVSVPSDDAAVAIVATPTHDGYWVVTRDGRILSVNAPTETEVDRCLASPDAGPPIAGAVGDPRPDASADLWVYSTRGGICGFNPSD